MIFSYKNNKATVINSTWEAKNDHELNDEVYGRKKKKKHFENINILIDILKTTFGKASKRQTFFFFFSSPRGEGVRGRRKAQ